MTINNEYTTTILSSYTIFKELDALNNIDKLKPILFNEVRKNSSRASVPDYLFKNIQIEIFSDIDNFSGLLNYSLDSLSSLLYIKDNVIYVKDDDFQRWQSIITKVSPLLIISYFVYKNDIDTKILNIFEHSVLPSIYNKKLNKLIQEKEIIDPHIHLNGTTEADVVWQDILKYPKLFLKEMEKSIGNEIVSEQYLFLEDSLSIKTMAENIYTTITIKEQFINSLNFTHNSTIKDEMLFYIKLFKKINLDKKCDDTFNLWKYILKYNFVYQLLVQQNKQVGFDQFEKITQNELREYTEKKYLQRYNQVNSIYNDNIKIEGRFAPKKTKVKMKQLLDDILKENKNISLVGHFIKKRDNRTIDSNFLYRDMNLRVELEQNSKIIVDLIKTNKIYKNSIKGFDGAGNELHTRPEVFASTFRYLRKENIGGFTFHGGEDFIDIVSGIRYIYEIIEFLDFEHGDRIGHATAIGIDPKLWKNRIGEYISISQGEYLDNLIFVYYFLSKSGLYTKKLHELNHTIQSLCFKVYGENIDINLLIEAWQIRKENPKKVLGLYSESCINYENRYSAKAIEIFIKYHSNIDVLKSYTKMTTMDTNFIKDKILISLQNITIEKLNKKNIIIETMLSSNVKISFYNSYNEHHVKRWLGLGKTKKYPKPTLMIATDDPGIFATNIRNELSHLYLILKNDGLDDKSIFSIIEDMLDDNLVYGFGG